MVVDGKCVIDVVPGARKPSYDISSFEEIRQAATRIMESCVDATPNPRNTGRGGYMGGIGMPLICFPAFLPTSATQ